MNQFLRNYRPDRIEKPLEEAYEEFLAEKEADNLRTATLKDYRSRIGFLVHRCPGKMVHEVTTEEVRALIKRPETGADCQNGVRRCLLTFFRWAVERKYCTENPVQSVRKTRADRDRPEILTTDKVMKLLAAGQRHKEGRMVPYLALALFAGLRHAELRRLSWLKIHFEEDIILVDGKEAKLRQNREIPISGNLKLWLTNYRHQPIYSENFRREMAVIRSLAGLEAWPQNVLRHTSLSFCYAKIQDEGKTAAFAGNSPDVIHRYYRNVVSRGETERFWSLEPKKET